MKDVKRDDNFINFVVKIYIFLKVCHTLYLFYYSSFLMKNNLPSVVVAG